MAETCIDTQARSDIREIRDLTVAVTKESAVLANALTDHQKTCGDNYETINGQISTLFGRWESFVKWTGGILLTLVLGLLGVIGTLLVMLMKNGAIVVQ